jgi:hypothetical protein
MSDESDIQGLLESLDPTTRTLVAEIDMGQQAREFVESDLGRYLVGCAHQEILDAQRALKRVLPWRRRRIQELQNRIWRAESLLLWLRSLIEAGKSAGQTIEEVES